MPLSSTARTVDWGSIFTHLWEETVPETFYFRAAEFWAQNHWWRHNLPTMRRRSFSEMDVSGAEEHHVKLLGHV